ncbi:SAM-dependent methyltransferase [Paenibacillus turicensis]|uniref:SAM-dependent methyltransferase n=1 Tax=Paenibacillus turicensis TaxID=160487 RepID=A0ABS4FXF0_9BACL|nr:class I SAM-dependent methyltransferase [Paenibacillus turicensis]MBP1907249.1 SAM-dependent methyltransferase [Paenibacillus turicensis]
MDERLIFNEVADKYEKYRPQYVPALFKTLIEYSNINGKSHALEIGIGTGQATRPILDTGCQITAIELGDKLADYSRNKFSQYANLDIKNIPFEEYEGDQDSFDLIYSATAFHWIPVELGFPKLFNLLKPGGAIALFWNRPFVGKEDDPLHQAIGEIYTALRPDSSRKVLQHETKRYERTISNILNYGFTDLEFRLLHHERQFNAEEYVALLQTYSDHAMLSKDLKGKFEDRIKEVILAHGNELQVYDTIEFYLARKPEFI